MLRQKLKNYLPSVWEQQLRLVQTAKKAGGSKKLGPDRPPIIDPPKGYEPNCKTKFGPLDDCDRVFQNLYGRHDWRLHGACQRGDWHRTAELLEQGPEWIMKQVSKSGLRGRGGAGFYAGLKWEFLRQTKSEKVPKMVIVNCAEGEPGTCKDRDILRHEPHKLIEGILLVGVAMGCGRAIVYIRNRFYNEACNLHFALAEAYHHGLLGNSVCGTGIKFDVMVQRGDRYLCGEETAMINCLMGKLGRPRRRPPFLTEKGYFEHPCLVINAESIAVVPTILRRGSQWWAGLGRSYNTGTKLYCLSGQVNNPCTVEEEMSIPLKDLIERHAGGVKGGWDNLAAVFPGGLSTPLLDPSTAGKVLMDFDSLTDAGSGFGCGAVIVMTKDCDPLAIMLRSIQFFEKHTCKQCSYCRDGAIWLPEIFARFVKGQTHPHEIDWTLVIADKMRNSKPICALAYSQVSVAESLVRMFSRKIEERLLKYAKGS
uniref:NADH dehydrogenase (Ubiquinone) 51 kDa subunit-like 2, isoform A n=1 Tax=Drosophila melanogaster TaxID=7227 RepID=A1Z9Z7_DROME|nr:NADH dehydrogenase (ubiquinone) 51 kDa subunit-like 2, isoform A [Drosophila melanogaster]AAF58152.1 NADH dehydrogenase (ubiquinone) 51 kDa subunit-like 2, isoform A [Drosophila melanogaster]|eukprot:NP_725449.1 NADH dehydrogenase (ubiquinone) 51 kDa subunit-like 2, isoform A [Drosophila melanogaster]